MEDIVAKHEASAVVADEVLADSEGLSESIGRRLLCIAELDPVVGTVAKEALESREVEWR